MENKENISLPQRDLLKEVGTIGAGRAATALAELLNCRVEISLPEAKILPLTSLDRALGDPEDESFVLDIGVEGDIKGRILFLLSPQEAKILGSILLGKKVEETEGDDVLFHSSLKELVNILSGAYITALSELTGLNIRYTIPSLAVDMVSAILDFLFIYIARTSEEAIFIETNLKIKGANFKGLFLFFPDRTCLKKLFSALGVF